MTIILIRLTLILISVMDFTHLTGRILASLMKTRTERIKLWGLSVSARETRQRRTDGEKSVDIHLAVEKAHSLCLFSIGARA